MITGREWKREGLNQIINRVIKKSNLFSIRQIKERILAPRINHTEII
jgi:hypothetical protein